MARAAEVGLDPGVQIEDTLAAALDHAGLIALQVQLRATREVLFARFLEFWAELVHKGFRARLEYPLTERSEGAIIEDQP